MAVDVLRPLDDNSPDPKQKLNHDIDQQKTQDPYEKRLTPYERLGRDLIEDERCAKELSLGKRIGFYRFRGDLGSGNFAQVKLAIHCLAKGTAIIILLIIYIYFSLELPPYQFKFKDTPNVLCA